MNLDLNCPRIWDQIATRKARKILGILQEKVERKHSFHGIIEGTRAGDARTSHGPLSKFAKRCENA
jgi:hypothetical protein